jgi:hypothetical protein
MPEEDVGLASRKSAVTRQAYAGDVRLFMRAVGMTSRAELRQVDHKAVIGWERHMCDVQQLHPTTIRRRLAALSSLFRHLVQDGIVAINPVREIERPAMHCWQGMTPAFSPAQARALLKAPAPSTLKRLRDRAGDLDYDGARKRRQAGGCPADGGACGSCNDTIVRSAAISTSEIGSLTRGLLSGSRHPRDTEALWFEMGAEVRPRKYLRTLRNHSKLWVIIDRDARPEHGGHV